MRHQPDVPGVIYGDLPNHDFVSLRAQVDLLTGYAPSDDHKVRVLPLPGREMVQATRVG
jgi:hypothetical protein